MPLNHRAGRGQAQAQADPSLSFTETEIYSHFAGRFLKETPPEQGVNFVTTWLTFRF
jgi:hypothetical protein